MSSLERRLVILEEATGKVPVDPGFQQEVPRLIESVASLLADMPEAVHAVRLIDVHDCGNFTMFLIRIRDSLRGQPAALMRLRGFMERVCGLESLDGEGGEVVL